MSHEINKIDANTLKYITSTLLRSVKENNFISYRGRVIEVTGTIIKAIVPNVKIGELCLLQNSFSSKEGPLLSEVIGFSNNHAILTPMGDMLGISSKTEVIPTGKTHEIAVGDNLLGKIINGLGYELDTGLEIEDPEKYYSVYSDVPSPMSREIIDSPISLGVKSIDGLLTCGEGQRMGIFAAAGGGKSTLLAMIIRNTDADVIVLALIGERGREVKEFLEHDLGEEGRKRAVIVVSTSDRPSMERAKAAFVATTIAEHFRDKGKKVLLLMDSVTRFARALREIGLAVGEPPTRRGFPPSVFSELPKLMERPGKFKNGSITALYTVLVEGDDMTEPVADETRSILDGHIILSRKLAQSNHYPAVDILQSKSRVMDLLISEEHKDDAAKLRELLSKYEEIELLVKIGEYKKGNDELGDEALDKIKSINEFLKQKTHDKTDLSSTINLLKNSTQ